MFKKEIFKNTVISSDKKKFDLDGAHFLINHSRIQLVKRLFSRKRMFSQKLKKKHRVQDLMSWWLAEKSCFKIIKFINFLI